MASQASQAPPNTIQILLTAKEISSFLCVHLKTIYKWAAEGKLPHRKIYENKKKREIGIGLDEIIDWESFLIPEQSTKRNES